MRRYSLVFLPAVFLLADLISGSAAVAAEPATDEAAVAGDVQANEKPAADPPTTVWLGDYRRGMQAAKAAGKMAFIWFQDPKQPAADAQFERSVLQSDAILPKLADFVTIRLPLGATVLVDGEPIRLLSHPAFAEMQGQPGIAMVDQRDPASPHYGRVVTVYPWKRDYITAAKLALLLDLPEGSLTQRTLMFAVRTHPERPQSAWSHTSALLTAETEKHAAHQANIHLQGHHNWDQRFHQINARLPSGLVANEVCAESWPGQNLVEAAEECVHCWRQSSGHWDHVRRRHVLFGFDMKRGRNGVWYAAGIFASRR